MRCRGRQREAVAAAARLAAAAPPPAYLTIDTRSGFFSAGGAVSASVVPAGAGSARRARGWVPRGARAPTAGLAAEQRCIVDMQYVYEAGRRNASRKLRNEFGRLWWVVAASPYVTPLRVTSIPLWMKGEAFGDAWQP